MLRQKADSSRKPEQGTLRCLYPSPKLETLFIAVPGIGTKPPDEWTNEAGHIWLTAIQAPGIGVFEYDHHISRSSDAIWQDLLDHGKSLLKSLANFVETQRLQYCPILIVADSLGGFIVKEAIRLASERTDRDYRSFLRILAGAILMGTPHSSSSKEIKWQNIAFLPHIGGIGLKSLSMRKDDIHRLTRCCMNFDQAASLCPILTICEKKETKIMRLKSKRVMLVDRDFAKTGSRNEEVIEIDSTHKDLCNVSNNKKMLDFIETVLGDARLNIVKGSPAFTSADDEWSDIGHHGMFDVGEQNFNPISGADHFTASATAGTSEFEYEIVPMSSTAKIERKVPNLPHYSIPVARNKDFYGRNNVLDAIDGYFFSAEQTSNEDRNNAKTFAICGPGGMGKTQIVTEYAHRCKEKCAFDAIFWIYANEPSKITDGIAQIALNLSLVAEDSVDALDPVITANLTKSWLANPVKNENVEEEEFKAQASWLIILDNVDNLKVLNGFWPFDGPGCILITSRDPLAKEPIVLAEAGVELGPFSTDESSSLIEKLTNRKGFESREVGRRLGGLPLAIAQMASVIIRNHLTFKEFNQAWDEKETHKDFLKSDEQWGHAYMYEKDLSTVWAIENLRHGKILLDVIAFLDPDIIPEYVLKASSSSLNNYPTSTTAYHKARTELLQTSLISKDSTAQKITVHRLVQDAARSKMESAYYEKTLSTAIELICSSWPFEAFGWRHGVTRWKRCEELFPHVHGLMIFGSNLSISNDTLDTNIKYSKLMNDAGWYYHETGQSIESQPFVEMSQRKAILVQDSLPALGLSTSIAKDINKQLNDIIAETHHNLGCVGTETNQPEFTLNHFKKYNEMIIQEIDHDLQKTDNRLAISWNELGNAYMMNKAWADGERCFKECLSVAQQMTEFNPAEFSFPYVNLGLAFWLTGRFERAMETLLEGLHYREAEFGRDDNRSFM